MSTLYLHIGYDKTGSSYLQSLFALNFDALEEQGIFYPIGEDEKAYAASGMVSSGNSTTLKDPNWTKLAAEKGSGSFLISYEGLFNLLTTKPEETLEEWERWRRELRCEKVSILLFIRDPIDHAASNFQQAAKTALVSETSLSDYFHSYVRPVLLLKVLEHLQKSPTISVTVRNYSRAKKEIKSIAEGWLGLEKGTLRTSNVPKTVNRSLTFSELRLVLALSRESKDHARELANAFSNKLPKKTLPGCSADRNSGKALASFSANTGRNRSEDRF